MKGRYIISIDKQYMANYYASDAADAIDHFLDQNGYDSVDEALRENFAGEIKATFVSSGIWDN